MGLFAELQSRIPDKWFFQRLLPAAVYVVIAVVCGAQLGQGHWADIGLARTRVAAALSGGDVAASVVLIAVAAAVLALAVPPAAAGVDILVSGAWPWWLVPLGSQVKSWRTRRWVSPDNLGKAAVSARADGHEFRAARLDSLLARASAKPPQGATWAADQFASVRERVPQEASAQWPWLRLLVPDSVRAAMGKARDAYDTACEAIVWSIAVTVLGVWWWPAIPAGAAMWFASWRWLRRAVTGLCDTTEWVFERYGGELSVNHP